MSQRSEHLLRYRPWKGELQPPLVASLAIARMSLRMLLRRKIFWALYALALMIFFFFFYGQYLVVWITEQTASQTVMFGGIPIRVGALTSFLGRLNLNGSPHTFGNFIWFEGYIAMIVLALAGAILVGNDFHHGSLPFYLSKPISKFHYLLGKILGAGTLINLMTTIPAVILFVQAGLLYDWQEYYTSQFPLLLGVLGYGLLLTLTLGLLLITTAVLVRQTVPLIMIWTGLFVLCRTLGGFLVDGQLFHPRLRLIDLWNDLYLVGLWMLGAERKEEMLGSQPAVWEAGLTIGLVCGACLWVLRGRIQAVEVVRS